MRCKPPRVCSDMNEPTPRPVWPAPESRMIVTTVPPPHPAVIDVNELMRACDARTQTRSGPGGQHRNRTESGVFVTWSGVDVAGRPITIVGEGTEKRQQSRNRSAAVLRLRMNLAIAVRTPSPLDCGGDHDVTSIGPPQETTIRERFAGTSLRLADDNDDKASVLSMLLNDLHAAGGQPSLIAGAWRVSTSRILACVRSEPAAWAWTNKIRAHHGRGPLR